MTRIIKSFFSRSHIKSFAVLLAAASLLMSGGCKNAQSDESGTLRVGVALYSQDDTFIATVVQNLERMAQEREGQEKIKINLSIADGHSNQTTQLEQVERFLERGCDLLCVNIVDRTVAAVIVDKAEEAEVPLIFFNRQPVAEDIQRWDKTYYVGARAQEGGTLQGELVLGAWQSDESFDRNGDGVMQYLMLEGEQGHQDSLLRTEYSIKAITDAGIEVEKLASDTANWNRGQASAKMSQWIDRFGNDIEVVIAKNDDMALGAIDAFKEAGLELPLIVGVDATAPALEAVASGRLYGTVLNDAAGIADVMLDMLMALTSGADLSEAVKLEDGHYVWLPYRQVTRDNLDEFIS